MTIVILFFLLVVIAIYWIKTQILPERRRASLLRPSLADGLLDAINERRHERGLPVLEMDPDLAPVAENKASHQLLTGIDEEGWVYPHAFDGMFGRSLLLEALVTGPAASMGDRLARQRELFDGEWITCGIGVAGAHSSGQIVVALILCREAWEPVAEVAAGHSLLQRLALGE